MKLFSRRPVPRPIPHHSEFSTAEEAEAWITRVFDEARPAIIKGARKRAARSMLIYHIKEVFRCLWCGWVKF